jgi:hypothetical protein
MSEEEVFVRKESGAGDYVVESAVKALLCKEFSLL